MRTMIHPEFTPDDLAANALELCDLFLLRRAARRKPAPAQPSSVPAFFISDRTTSRHSAGDADSPASSRAGVRPRGVVHRVDASDRLASRLFLQ